MKKNKKTKDVILSPKLRDAAWEMIKIIMDGIGGCVETRPPITEEEKASAYFTLREILFPSKAVDLRR